MTKVGSVYRYIWYDDFRSRGNYVGKILGPFYIGETNLSLSTCILSKPQESWWDK